ncbi:hypothetical protein BBK36DRAFT_1200154, partial [Trichoderma citrinoviride]
DRQGLRTASSRRRNNSKNNGTRNTRHHIHRLPRRLGSPGGQENSDAARSRNLTRCRGSCFFWLQSASNIKRIHSGLSGCLSTCDIAVSLGPVSASSVSATESGAWTGCKAVELTGDGERHPATNGASRYRQQLSHDGFRSCISASLRLHPRTSSPRRRSRFLRLSFFPLVSSSFELSLTRRHSDDYFP